MDMGKAQPSTTAGQAFPCEGRCGDRCWGCVPAVAGTAWDLDRALASGKLSRCR